MGSHRSSTLSGDRGWDDVRDDEQSKPAERSLGPSVDRSSTAVPGRGLWSSSSTVATSRVTRGSATSAWPSTGSPSSRSPALATTTRRSPSAARRRTRRMRSPSCSTRSASIGPTWWPFRQPGTPGSSSPGAIPIVSTASRSSRPWRCHGLAGRDAAGASCSDPCRRSSGVRSAPACASRHRSGCNCSYAADDAQRGAGRPRHG